MKPAEELAGRDIGHEKRTLHKLAIEILYHQPPSRFERAHHLLDGVLRLRNVAQNQALVDKVKGRSGKGSTPISLRRISTLGLRGLLRQACLRHAVAHHGDIRGLVQFFSRE
jgi:hypothetical protein